MGCGVSYLKLRLWVRYLMPSILISYSYQGEEYTATGTPACVVRGDCVGAERWAGNPHLYILFLGDFKSEKGERGG